MLFFMLAFLSAGEVSMKPEFWEVPEQAFFVNHFNRESLYIENGYALLKDATLKNGIYEVDIHTFHRRGFAGILFRAESAGEGELLYLRLHKSNQPDAVQYTPRYNNMSGWQLYHGKGFTGPVTMTPDGFTHVKMRVEGGSLALYLNGNEKPAFETNKLQRNPVAGRMGLWGLRGAYFSGFRYTPLPDGGQPAQSPEGVEGALTQWELSPSVPARKGDLTIQATELLTENQDWTRVKTGIDGLLDIGRYRDKPQRRSVVLAQTSLQSETGETVSLHFGYSDDVVIFLNGKPVYGGQNGFRVRSPVAQGLVESEHDRIYLNLKPGENRLVFAVADVFGGWGLAARVSKQDNILSP